jgi:hypothetical protein
MMLRTAAASALLVTCAAALNAQSALRAQPSTRATTTVVLEYPEGQAPAGVTGPLRIHVDYGQPHLRGRQLHSGSLVPYDRVWRTGANATTTFTTDVDLTIGGVHVPSGTYSLFTLPSATGWKLIVNRFTGEMPQYDTAHDVARIDLRSRTLPAPVESLTITLVPTADASPAAGELRLAWGTGEHAVSWSVR